ncbi:AraC family transcriptional regulator [Embleya sp. NPDC008237]|uniref:AraC family transcriptional regulator n=1 Tax=Embleya sp. NPDC008237 TaxID=3363978 RepID=UPI0036EEB274
MRPLTNAVPQGPDISDRPPPAPGHLGTHDDTVIRIPAGPQGPLDTTGPGPDESEIAVVVPLDGAVVLAADGVEQMLPEGAFAILDGRCPCTITSPYGCDPAVLRLPRTLLTEPDEVLRRAVGRVLPADRGTAALVVPAAVSLRRTPAPAPPLLDRMTHHLADLVSTLLAELDEPPQAGPETALMSDIRWYVNCRLGDPGLSPETIAAAHYVSVRYLHKLFEGRDMTLGRWIQLRRLQECRRELGRPGSPPPKVGAVAQRWGFVNSGHFSRTFRAAFGMSPRDWREARTAASRSHRP